MSIMINLTFSNTSINFFLKAGGPLASVIAYRPQVQVFDSGVPFGTCKGYQRFKDAEAEQSNFIRYML